MSANEFMSAASQYSSFTGMFSLAREELTAQQAKDVVAIFEVVENSRSEYEKAVNGFSMYDYVNSFGHDMDAYLKEEDDASAFYNKICSYLWKDHGVCKLIYTYWRDNLIAK